MAGGSVKWLPDFVAPALGPRSMASADGAAIADFPRFFSPFVLEQDGGQTCSGLIAGFCSVNSSDSSTTEHKEHVNTLHPSRHLAEEPIKQVT